MRQNEEKDEYNEFWVKFAKNVGEVMQEYNKLSLTNKQRADMEARNILAARGVFGDAPTPISFSAWTIKRTKLSVLPMTIASKNRVNFKTFFNETANAVINYCKTHNIAYHIKTGTITEE